MIFPEFLFLWAPVIALAAITAFLCLKLKSCLAPASIFAILWLVMLVLNVAFRPDYLVSAGGLWIVCLFVFCFGLGSIFSDVISLGKTPSCDDTSALKLPFLRLITLSLSLIGFCAVLVVIRDHIGGTDGSNLWDVFHQLAIAEKNFRYSGSRRPLYFSLLNTAVYGSALFGGLLFSRRISGSKIIGLAPLMVALVYSLITTAKATLLQPLLMWLSAYGSGLLLQAKNKEVEFRISGFIAISFIAIVISAITLFTFYLRYPDKSLLDAVALNIENYITFGLPPFVYWAHNISILHVSPDYGKWTFSGIADFLGLGTRELGIYKEFFEIGPLSSNLYSAFRGLIQDFTFPGAILLTLATGALANLAYRSMKAGEIAMTGILVGMYSFVLWSPIVSLFVYNAILFAVILFAFYCVLARWIIKLN